eukprot:442760-Alexandrium_andersonii.AAC.1
MCLCGGGVGAGQVGPCSQAANTDAHIGRPIAGRWGTVRDVERFIMRCPESELVRVFSLVFGSARLVAEADRAEAWTVPCCMLAGARAALAGAIRYLAG